MWKEKLRTRRRIKQDFRSIRSRGGIRASDIKAIKFAKLAKYSFFGLVGLFVLGIVVFQIFALTLPSPDKIVRRDGFSTKILDRNGKLLYDIFVDERRTSVPLSDIPEYLKEATIAVEDKNFYKHQGFDPLAYARVVYNAIFRQKLQGGSTLTQQLVKNALLSNERTVIRKIKEFVITLQIERKYTKDQILALYLNEIPYGGTAWGAQAASETYFGKNVRDLNLVESAVLAGLPQRPSVYSPYSATPKAYIARAEHVLRRMREDGYITAQQEEETVKALPDVKFLPKGGDLKAPHFVQYVENILTERYGEKAVEQGGLKVTTTLDLDLQEKSQRIVSEEIEKVEKFHITNGAATVLNPETGEILAMVGSKNFLATDYDGQVNVVMSLRQPGSAIKPITYVTALKKGYTASTLLADTPTKFPGGANQPDYEPTNYDGKFRGPVQFRYALANSLNIPAVKVLALVGVKDTLQTAFDMGLTSLAPTDATLKRVGLSLTLGGGEVRLVELTGAYGAFMNGGHKVEPVAILKVEDRDGKVLEEVKPKKGAQVLSSEQAFLIANILSDNDARKETFGLNSLLSIPGRQVAVKTGTTNDKRDNWTIGGTPQVVVGVWVGNNDNSVMKQVASGVSGASPIWNKIIREALQGLPVVQFTQPEGIVTATVDAISGFRSHDNLPSRTEYFVKGTEPDEDRVHVLIKVCKNEGKLATPSDIAANNYDNKEFIILKENDPTGGPTNRWQEGIDTWIATQSDQIKYKPPTEYCSGINSAPLNVEFNEPRDRTSNVNNSFKIVFTVDAIEDISEARLEIDGVTVKTYSKGPYEYDAALGNGKHELRAVAKDAKGRESDRKIQIGVNTSWE